MPPISNNETTRNCRHVRSRDTVLGHGIPNKEALARFSDGALETLLMYINILNYKAR